MQDGGRVSTHREAGKESCRPEREIPKADLHLHIESALVLKTDQDFHYLTYAYFQRAADNVRHVKRAIQADGYSVAPGLPARLRSGDLFPEELTMKR